MKIRACINHVLFLGAAILAAAPGHAQEPAANNLWRDWDITIGVLGEYEAVSPGVDEYSFGALPYFDITYKDRFFLKADKGLGANIYESDNFDNGFVENFSVAAAIGYAPGRDASDFEDRTHLKGLGDLDGSVEARLFVEADLGILEGEFEFGHGLNSDGHDGWYAEAGLVLDNMVSENLYLSAGPSVRFSSENFQQAYYGVTSTQAAATGLTQYSPGTGGESASFEVMSRYFLTEDWTLLAKGEYRYLLNDAKDSPIVDQKGQFSALFGIAYSF